MARLTLRVPDSLQVSLSESAKREGVSMNQYLVFALSRIAAADDITRQKEKFDELVSRYSRHESESALSEILKSRLPAS